MELLIKFSLITVSFFYCQFNIVSSEETANNNELINIIDQIAKAISPQNFRSVFENVIARNSQANNVSDCVQQLSIFQNATATYEQWALQMLDASSKIPSGILKGNLKDIGMYDECISVTTVKNNITIQGRHCMYTVNVTILTQNITITPTLSVCLPAACDNVIVKEFLQSTIDKIPKFIIRNLSIKILSVTCSTVTSEPWSIGGIITLVAIGILIGFLVICTIYDIYARINTSLVSHNESKCSSNLRQFSLYTNSQRILSTKAPRGNLPAISGLRFFSMCWVIIGHTYVQRAFGGFINIADILIWLHSWDALYILVAPLAVDTFLVLSGVLVAYYFLKTVTVTFKFNPITYYLHRYIRLTPALGALLLFSIHILPYFGSGALWQQSMHMQKDRCVKNWWRMLLYIQNYGEIENLACLGHLWYLAVDMQLFWLSPLILYPLARLPKLGIIILGLFIIASIIVPATIFVVNGYRTTFMFSGGNINTITDYMLGFYIPTYTRSGPWLLGILVGYMIHSNKYRPTRTGVKIGWFVATITFVFSIFCWRIFQDENYKFNVYWETFYAGFGKHIWAFAICWIIYASALGHGGIISKFLSLPIFLPFSRISYGIYLVHFVIQTMEVSATRFIPYFTDIQMLTMFLSDLILCTMGGFVFTLLFESPFLALEKISLHGKKPVRNQQSNGIDNPAFVK